MNVTTILDTEPKVGQPMEQYALLMDAPAAIAILEGPHHKFKLANDNYMTLVGKDRQSIIGKAVRDAMPELDAQGFYELLDSVYETQQPFIGKEIPLQLIHESTGHSEQMFVNFIYKPIVDQGQSIGIFVHAYDVTESVQNRQRVEVSQRRYQSLLNSIDEGFCVIEMLFDEQNRPNDYRFIETNDVFAQQTGLTKPLNKRVKELQPDLESSWFETYGNVVKTREPIRFSQGSEAMGRWFDVYASPIEGQDGNNNLVAILFRDISDTKQAQLRLQNQKNLIETITNNVTVGLCMVDTDGKLTYINPAACKTTGFTSQESLGKSLHQLIHHTKPDGSPFAEKDCNLFQTYRNGKQFEESEVLFFKKDMTPFPARELSTPIQDNDTIQGSIIEFRDISDEKNAMQKVSAATKRQSQLEKTTESLQQQREHLIKLNEAKDEFISLASHQLRTPATGVKQYIGVVLQGYVGEISDAQKQMLAKAYETNERELTIVEDLLRVAQIDAGKVRLDIVDTDVNSLIIDVIAGFADKATQKQLKVLFKPNPAISHIKLDPKLIRMVLENLIDNAIKYTLEESAIVVEASLTAKQISIRVKDSGIGISDADKSKLFQKFSRVNSRSAAEVAGNGLGLYWVRQVLELHHGSVSITDNKPKGTVFHISLPR